MKAASVSEGIRWNSACEVACAGVCAALDGACSVVTGLGLVSIMFTG